MRYAHIYHAVTQKPWLITSAAHASIVGLLETRLGKSLDQIKAERPDVDFFGGKIEQMSFDHLTGIATIPIHGVMGKRLSMFEKSCGAVDTNDVAEDLDAALAMGARLIVLDVKSPGGMVDGTKDLAEKISEINSSKRAQVHAFTDEQMCSAAYWVSAGAYMIHSNEMASVGSIGVYMPWIDSTKRYEMFGYKVELIKAGRLKGQGYPGTSISDEQRALWQADVDRIYDKFTGFVKSHRSSVSEETMQGQCFVGEVAATNGLVDNVVKDLKDLKLQLSK